MIRILGIDPGSRVTGYGLVDTDGHQAHYITSGCIRLTQSTLSERIRTIFDAVTQISQQYVPDECAIEQVFVHRNADSALKLGQARGAAICAMMGIQASGKSIPLYEYSATQVKQSVVGRGHAAKQQVQHMIKILLNLSDQPQSDAADALAVAVCHAHHRESVAQRAASSSLLGGA